ncbi:MAG: hypothetical protein ACLU0O_05795 [Collinsella sp.]
MAHRHRSVTRAGDACQHAKILGRIADGPERLTQRRAIRARGKLAARALGFIQIAFTSTIGEHALPAMRTPRPASDASSCSAA